MENFVEKPSRQGQEPVNKFNRLVLLGHGFNPATLLGTRALIPASKTARFQVKPTSLTASFYETVESIP